MTVQEKLHEEAMFHLLEAKDRMRRLAVACPDWTANAEVNVTFQHVEEACRNFGRYQLGIPRINSCRTKRKHPSNKC